MDADHNRAVHHLRRASPRPVLEAAFQAVQDRGRADRPDPAQGRAPAHGRDRRGAVRADFRASRWRSASSWPSGWPRSIADELSIPVYLYELAATRPDRVDLAEIRRGEFEGLREAIRTDPDRAPDFGRPELHSTAGATVVGVRAPLVAYNVNLATTDVKVAERIAKAIRFRDGGFRFAKALGFEVKEKGCVQVSINMTDYTKTPLYRVFETVKREAARWGVNVIESEIVGLVPQGALNASARYFLQLNGFKKDQILENRLVPAKGLPDFLNDLASSAPTPGGGSAAALNGAIGVALMTMVANLTAGKKGYEEFSDELSAVRDRLLPLRERFVSLIDEDAESFKKVMAAYQLPKMTEADKQERGQRNQRGPQGRGRDSVPDDEARPRRAEAVPADCRVRQQELDHRRRRRDDEPRHLLPRGAPERAHQPGRHQGRGLGRGEARDDGRDGCRRWTRWSRSTATPSPRRMA